jgi:hypothetical protein
MPWIPRFPPRLEPTYATRSTTDGQQEGGEDFTAPLERLLGMPLDQYAKEGAPLEIRVLWLPETTLWFVPDLRHAQKLMPEGIGRGRIWTAQELMDLMATRGLTPEQVSLVAVAKLTFDGTLSEVRPR